jgi:hypothetical protein
LLDILPRPEDVHYQESGMAGNGVFACDAEYSERKRS